MFKNQCYQKMRMESDKIEKRICGAGGLNPLRRRFLIKWERKDFITPPGHFCDIFTV